MHIDKAEFPKEYSLYIKKKVVFLIVCVFLLIFIFIFSLCFGSVTIPVPDVIAALFRINTVDKWNNIIFNIRLPRIITALIAGAGLSISGVAMQSLLRNPLGSPFTLGISQSAAFGAALSVMLLGTGVMRSTGTAAITITNPYLTTTAAFICCLLTTGVLIGISKLKRSSPVVLVLTGVALGSLFQAGTMFLQFFADDVQLAAMVFWTFGDVGRTSWQELFIIMVTVSVSTVFFITQRWKYNALDAGSETAKSLGVPVERVRITGMVVASLVTSVIIAFIGIIGFIGLVCPHIIRRIIGDDHRFLIPGSCMAGAIILLAADTAARLILIPHVFPVAILTSFLGVPVFIYLIIKGYQR
ncbi:MAG: iron ABC transporter permease [Spirochaetales bacterium]|nr:iron ABC transporter permease [Spirochaetales bacterium]